MILIVSEHGFKWALHFTLYIAKMFEFFFFTVKFYQICDLWHILIITPTASFFLAPIRGYHDVSYSQRSYHSYHGKFMAYIRPQPWCCTFYGFLQMYNDWYSLL